MAGLDRILGKYTDPDTGSIHGATFVAVDEKGNDIYRKSFGHCKVNSKNGPALTPDTATWIASLTKLTTSVAAMQLVERGLIGLDDDVRNVIPQLQNLKVIIGFEGEGDQSPKINTETHQGGPILEDVKGPITLRQLLTHSSGFCYDLRHPLLVKYSEWAGRQENMFSGTIEGLYHPPVFQPGTSWEYGPGLDWVGQVIEKLTGMNYSEYQQINIWEPLGAKDTTFYPAKCGVTEGDIHELAFRAEGERSQNLKAGPSPWKFECRDALGGAGLFSTANDYSKLLSALLAGGGPLLSEASIVELFSPQLGVSSMAALREFVVGEGPEGGKAWLYTQSPEEWKDVMEIRHCLCGLLNSKDVAGRRRKNTVNWDGLPNLVWFIDRESGVAATLFTQTMPIDDPPLRQLVLDLETALYTMINST
ncbi:unnamed protein product [Clonostachys solani]|uniref:Beta-lactamase-related domain-containing protein n=1 Tax=Clonostachys solani TaxID=160281 RepID=A0A9P0EK48_9HYPO|nr:unnamed protein product [Clonostachys solani]